MKQYDIEVERVVIGDLLTFENIQDKTLLIEAGDFEYEEHKEVFTAMRKLYEKNGKYDFLQVSTSCKRNVKSVIQACIQVAVSVTSFDEHLQLLKDMASSRRLANGFNNLLYNNELNVTTVQQLVDNENEKKLTVDVKKANENNINGFIANLNKADDNLLTGFSALDGTLGGIRKGTVFIIGARPSTGKTAFSLNIAQNIFNGGRKVMFFSLEMSAEMIYERLMSAKLDIEYEKFSQKKLSDSEINSVSVAMADMMLKDRFYVLDDVYNVEHICNLIIEQQPDIAVVDFMQIISTTNKFQDTRARIDYISALFKRTAKKVGCSIMVLSQLSRAGKDAPTMSDLKESGGLEQDGDYIALLHRPYVLNKGDDIPPGKTEMLLDKNKFGRCGKLDLEFRLKYQQFFERDPFR